MLEFGIIQHVEDISVEEGTAASGLPDSVSIRNCIKGETIIPDRPQLPLELENFSYLFHGTFCTLLIAVITVVLEQIAKLFNCRLKKMKKRRKKKRKAIKLQLTR